MLAKQVPRLDTVTCAPGQELLHLFELVRVGRRIRLKDGPDFLQQDPTTRLLNIGFRFCAEHLADGSPGHPPHPLASLRRCQWAFVLTWAAFSCGVPWPRCLRGRYRRDSYTSIIWRACRITLQ